VLFSIIGTIERVGKFIGTGLWINLS